MAKRILVVRNDKLGDFVLSFPGLALLKRNLPDAEVHVLIPEYTREVAEACSWIDGVVIDSGQEGVAGARSMAETLRAYDFDAALAYFSTTRVALALRLAGIPYRLAPATKFAQIFYSDRLRQRRSLSLQPESEYNSDLSRHYLAREGIADPIDERPPFLRFPPDEIDEVRNAFNSAHGISEGTRLVFVHVGSGGSARNLSTEQYAELARGLVQAGTECAVLSAGPGEVEHARALAALLGDVPHVVYESTEGLRRFTLHLAMADVFISGSTGPLHLAGALDRPTAGFYPRRRSATSLRWRTLNSEARRLAFSPPDDAGEEDMAAIDAVAAAREIRERFL